MELVKTKERTLVRRTGVTISTRIDSAKTVAVSGDFSQWCPVGIPLERNGDDQWHVWLDLRPGEYQYRLLVNGRWCDHPEATRRVPNGFGTQNCVLSVE